MKKELKIIAVLMTILVLASGRSYAAFDAGTSARSIGMGGVRAVLKGADGIYGNPAGICDAENAEFTSMYSDLTGDTRYNMIGAIFKNMSGNWSIGYSGSRTGDLFVTEISADTGLVSAGAPFSYGVDEFSLGYGNLLNERLKYGFRAKYLSRGTELSGMSGNGMNADIGLIYEVHDSTDIGVMVTNAICGDTGSIKWSGGEKEEMPMVVNIGGRYEIGRANFYGEAIIRKTMPAELRFGAEYELVNDICLRGGIDQRNASFYERYTNYAAGVGYSTGNICVDYAYYIDTLVLYNSQHYISIGLSLD